MESSWEICSSLSTFGLEDVFGLTAIFSVLDCVSLVNAVVGVDCSEIVRLVVVSSDKVKQKIKRKRQQNILKKHMTRFIHFKHKLYVILKHMSVF